jgi:hypothetical protein
VANRWTREGRTLFFDGREICTVQRDFEGCEITPSDCDDLTAEILNFLNTSGRVVRERKRK